MCLEFSVYRILVDGSHCLVAEFEEEEDAKAYLAFKKGKKYMYKKNPDFKYNTQKTT